MLIKFTKMHGIGNDFVVIDNISGQFKPNVELIKSWANRHTGIGFDQLLLVGKAKNVKNDFSYTIYNCNGTQAYQCGNGARCFGLYVTEKGLTRKKKILVETVDNIIEIISLSDGNFSVNMGQPEFLDINHDGRFIEKDYMEQNFLQEINIGCNNKIKVFYLSLGNHHIVTFVDDINIDVEELGIKIQNKFNFVNVEFVKIYSRNSIKVRFFENGAGETLACGSGACAAAVAGIKCGFLDRDVIVYTIGGKLNINWDKKNDIIMTGTAQTVFEGVIEY